MMHTVFRNMLQFRRILKMQDVLENVRKGSMELLEIGIILSLDRKSIELNTRYWENQTESKHGN
jgi:hypothetical protein